MPPPSLAQMFDKAVQLVVPELPMDKAVPKQPDDVRAIGELKVSSQPPMESRLFDSEVSLVPEPEAPIRPLEEQQTALFPVKVAQIGGVQGTSTSIATFSYQVTDLQGTILDNTDVNPILPQVLRPNIGRVRIPPNTENLAFGLAFFDETDALRLWSVGEAIQAGACP